MQRHHVRSWAERLDARYGLPELVRRLVQETSGGPVVARFASDEGVDVGGFDGTVRAEAGSHWVPRGCSVWEVSTERSVGTKADEDYEQRREAPPGWSMSETTYVAVSLRAWQERDKWAQRRTGEGRWREVRALGLDDVMSWLAEAPLTELWLAERLGLHPEERKPARRWWEDRQRSTGGLFDCSVALAGRSDAAEEFRRRIDGSRGPVVVEAAAIDEALEFIAAAGQVSGESAMGERLLDRMVFVRSRRVLQRLLTEEGPEMVLVLADPELGAEVVESRHKVVIAVQVHGGAVAARRAADGTRDCVVVPRLDSRAVAEALNTAEARSRGFDFRQAQNLGAMGHRSATALRRALSVEATMPVPHWALAGAHTSSAARQAKTAALLAGQWKAGSPEYASVSGDREVLVRLAGGNISYEELERELGSMAGLDPMLSVSDSTWRLVHPNEAWHLLAEHLLTADALHRFLQVAVEVLGERNPLDDLSGVEQLAAQLRGVGRRYSRALRLGVARTLTLLCVHGSQLTMSGRRDPCDLARRCVGSLIQPEAEQNMSVSARVRRLTELGEVLTLLAEAAPDEFISAVDRTLQPPLEAAQLWFTDTWDDLSVAGASSPHTQLLFALETLAWLPDHLAGVADILVRLEALDSGGRLANRPAATFAAIFSYWAPQTGVDHHYRLEVLRGLRDRLLSTSTDSGRISALARLFVSLMPRSGSIIMSSSCPQIRDYQLPPDQVSGEVVSDYLGEVVELLVSVTEYRVRDCRDAAGMLDLLQTPAGVTTATLLPPEARERLWTLFEQAVPMFEPDELSVVGRRLEGLLRSHRSYADADWALSAAETDRLARLARVIAADRDVPGGPVEANLWLFSHFHPDLGQEASRIGDLAAYEQTLQARRTDAIGEVLQAEGLDGLFRLAERAEADGRVAPVGVIGTTLEELQSRPLENTDGGQFPSTAEAETRMLDALDLPADNSATSPSQRRHAAVARGYFYARLRRTRQTDGDGWTWLNELLHGDGATAEQQAGLLELTHESPRAWQEAEALGPAALTAYWRLMHWYGLDKDSDHLEDIAQGLLSVGRAADAVALLANRNETSSLDPRRRAQLAADALEALALTGATRSASAVDAWHITQLFDSLAQHTPLTEDNLDDPLLQRLTQLEMVYAELRRPDEPAPFIHDRMSLDPRSFVEVVSLAYPHTNAQTPDLTPHDDETPDPPAQLRIPQGIAYRILTSWQRPPGSDGSAAVDYSRMTAWIDEAQQLLNIEGRREDGDGHIGQVLSAAPPDPTDGIAPPVPIRQLLEEGQTPELRNGLGSGLLRGPTGFRCDWVGALVAESQQARQEAQRNATMIAARWPRTAQLLREVAEAHQHEARSWQDDPDPID